MQTNEISLHEEEAEIKAINKKNIKVLKKVNFEDIASDITTYDLNKLKNHLIVIKKKRNRDNSTNKNNNISSTKNLLNTSLPTKRKKTEDSSEYSNIDNNSDFTFKNLGAVIDTINNENGAICNNNASINKNFISPKNQKYDFSLSQYQLSNNENSRAREGILDYEELSNNKQSLKNFAKKSLLPINYFSSSNSNNDPNLLLCTSANHSKINKKKAAEKVKDTINTCNTGSKAFSQTLNKIKEESEAFKNFFPIILSRDMADSIYRKENLESLAQEQSKFNEIKKMNLMQRRNMLSKARLRDDFKNLQNKYKNLFGEKNFTKSSKLISNDEIMVIHIDNAGASAENKMNIEGLISDIKLNSSNSFDMSLYEINKNFMESEFNLGQLSDQYLLKKIYECENENLFLHEKENLNKGNNGLDSDEERNLFDQDNDSNKEDNPANDYPDEESSEDDNDYERYADVYNKKHFSYQQKINKLENMLNKEFKSMEISNKDGYNKSGYDYNYSNNHDQYYDSDTGYGDYYDNY